MMIFAYIFIYLLIFVLFISTFIIFTFPKINPADKIKFDYIKYQLKRGVRLENLFNNLGYYKNLDLQKQIDNLKWEQKQILEDNDFYQKENEKLKAEIAELNKNIEKK